MHQPNYVVAIIIVVTAALFAMACGALSIDVVVYDKLKILEDGQSLSIGPLDAATYRLELTASGDGAAVEWIGGNCRGTNETRGHTEECDLRQTGQVQVINPTTFGMGKSSSVTVKITKLGD